MLWKLDPFISYIRTQKLGVCPWQASPTNIRLALLVLLVTNTLAYLPTLSVKKKKTVAGVIKNFLCHWCSGQITPQSLPKIFEYTRKFSSGKHSSLFVGGEEHFYTNNICWQYPSLTPNKKLDCLSLASPKHKYQTYIIRISSRLTL